MPSTSLTDGVVTLRPLRSDDAVCMHTAICESLSELKPWMTWAHDNYQKKEAQDWITMARARWNDGSYYGFAILSTEKDDFLGACSLSQFHPLYNFCNLGYWIRTSRRGHGFAGRAARLATRFAFERLNLIRVEIVIATGNAASRRVAEKIGAHCEGIQLSRLLVRDEIQDACMYSFVPADFGLKPNL